jgi:hypothetical protein
MCAQPLSQGPVWLWCLTAFGLVEELENLFGSSLHDVIGNARQQIRIAY